MSRVYYRFLRLLERTTLKLKGNIYEASLIMRNR